MAKQITNTKIKKTRQTNAKAEQVRSANTKKSVGFLSDQQASILNDYIRLYVGSAMPYPSSSSGVYMNQDTILMTQWYLNKAGYPLYDEVELDPQVSATLQARKLAPAGLPWHIVSDDPAQDNLCEAIENKIRAIPGFYQDMIELLDAIGKGFAVSEIEWGVDTDGWVVPMNLWNRPQRRMQFNATDATLKIRTLNDPFWGEPALEKKFIIHRNSQKYENPFGDAIDQRIYWMWMFKRTVTKFWLNFLEAHAGPSVFVTVPKNASDTLKQEAMNIAENMRQGTGGYKTAEMTIDPIVAKDVAQSADTYLNFIKYADEEITKAYLSQTLTTEASGTSGSGSKALGTVHQSVKQDLLQYDAKCLASTLTNTLVQWMCDFNIVGLKIIPRFEFIIEEPQDKVALSTMVKNITDAGFHVSNDYVESILGIELNDAEPDVAVKPDTEPQGIKSFSERPKDLYIARIKRMRHRKINLN